VELTLIHDGQDWIAFDQEQEFKGKSLEELDARVKEYVLSKGLVSKGRKMQVWMYFNNAVIPEWMRQYMQHYFNRILVVEP